MTPEKATEQSREVYRFEIKVPAGKSLTHEVVEEQARVDHVALHSTDDQHGAHLPQQPGGQRQGEGGAGEGRRPARQAERDAGASWAS